MLDTDAIRTRRERLGLSQERAAERAGFASRQRWYHIESGQKANIELDTLARLARALECNPRDLLKPESK